MLEFLAADQNLPFTVSLTVMFGIALLEGVATLLGAGISGFLDTLIPDLDLNTGMDLDSTGSPLTRLLGWLRVGQVPVLIILVIFLTTFGLLGLVVQSMVNSTAGFLLPGLVASAIVFFPTLPVVRVLGGALGAIMPKDETDAVSEDSLVGRVATITLGTASKGNPAQGKVRDQHGLTHYIMIEPDAEGISFSAEQSVLLIQKEGSVFRAIENTNPALIDK